MKDPRYVLPLCPACAYMVKQTAFGGAIWFCSECEPKASQVLRIMLSGAPCYAIARCTTCDLDATEIRKDGDGITWNCPKGCHP